MRRIALDHKQNKVVKYKEIHAAFKRNDKVVEVRECGDHTVYGGPTGICPVPHDHGGDCPRGTWRSIVRQAFAAGLVCFALAVIGLAVVLNFVA